MRKARRSPEENFYDVFADMAVDEQVIALKLMAHEHHQAVRRAGEKPEPESARIELLEELRQSVAELSGSLDTRFEILQHQVDALDRKETPKRENA